MIPLRVATVLALVALVLPAWGAPVKVIIASENGNSPAGTVVVFDPKDPMPPGEHATAIIDQVDRKFVPLITVIRTGTSVRFPNSDNVRHQVYSFSAPKTFTLRLYSGQPSEPVVFDKPGLVVLGCNIHDRMAAFVGIVDTPYFGTADAGGLLSLNLPPGRYRMRVWHPNLASPVAMQPVDITEAGLAMRVPVTVRATAASVATWPE